MELLPGIESGQELKKKAIDDINLLFLEMKRDSDLFRARNVERMKIFKQKVGSESDIPDKSNAASSTQVAPTPTQQFYKNPVYHAYMDELVSRTKHAQSLDIPSFEEFEDITNSYNKSLDEEQRDTTKRNESPQNIEKGLDDTVINIANDVVKPIANEKERLNEGTKDKGQLLSSHNTNNSDFSYESDNGTQYKDKADSPTNEDSDATEDRTTDKNLYLLHTNREEECMDVVDYDFGCLLECGDAEDETILLSKYMIQNSELMRPLLRLRKEVVDYCYLTDHNYMNDERLATFGLLQFLSKDDAKSMMADELITTSVIECWSIMLNELIVTRVLTDEPPRVYMRINHMEQVIDLLTTEDDKRVAYVQEIFNARRGWGRCYKSPLNLDSDMAHMLGEFLVENGVQKGQMVKSFPMRKVQFKWKCTELYDNLDSGVLMTFHMLFYVGKIFDCDLGNATSRIVYRARILAILVMSELNCTRDKLLEKVEEIKNEKEALLPVLVEQRRKKAEEEAKSQ